MSNELRHIITGIDRNTERNLIKTTLFFLRESERTSREIEKSKLINKEDEIKQLSLFASKNNLLFQSIDESKYLGEGAEQKVYLNDDGRSVIKINDSIFYSSWKDYFISLLIHNFLFPSTEYTFLGFYRGKEKTFYAIVKQSFIQSTEPTDLEKVKLF